MKILYVSIQSWGLNDEACFNIQSLVLAWNTGEQTIIQEGLPDTSNAGIPEWFVAFPIAFESMSLLTRGGLSLKAYQALKFLSFKGWNSASIAKMLSTGKTGGFVLWAKMCQKLSVANEGWAGISGSRDLSLSIATRVRSNILPSIDAYLRNVWVSLCSFLILPTTSSTTLFVKLLELICVMSQCHANLPGIEDKQALGIERFRKFPHEEGVAPRFFLNQTGEGLNVAGPLVNDIRDDFCCITGLQGPDPDAFYEMFGYILNHSDKWMGFIHFIVPVSQDKHKGPILDTHHGFDKVKGRQVCPLEIIEEKNKGMFPGAEKRHKIIKNVSEPVPGFRRLQGDDGRLGADDKLQFRDKVDDDLAVCAKGILDLLPPQGKAFIRFRQELVHQFPECPDDGAVGGIPDKLVELG